MRTRPNLRLIGGAVETVENAPDAPKVCSAAGAGALPAPPRKAWHERLAVGVWLRRRLRGALLAVLRKLLETDEGKAQAATALKGLLRWRPEFDVSTRSLAQSPYSDLGKSRWGNEASRRGDVIMITGRFRSGSTLLWNIFRHVDGCVAFYEPFNERRWFDPALRGEHVDPSHKQVDDYSREYEGFAQLGQFYREEWISRNLYMDPGFWEPAMKQYVDLLINEAPGRPVLQFNRIDFRLPWIRRNYPTAKIVHLYRHPRDQWCSALLNPNCFSKDGSVDQFAQHDGFYLLGWARDLKYHFPFLEEKTASHPYQLFYYIWKLSYLFGREYSDYSVCFEDLVGDPAPQLEALFRAMEVETYDLDKLIGLVVKPEIGKWKEYADDLWFLEQEIACETVLAEFLAQG
jgi:hypothetical protein